MGFWVASTKNGSASGRAVLPTVTCRSCMASSKRGLRFGWCAVDLIGQDDVGKNRPFQKAALALARVAVLLYDFGAGDVGGHQVGRELDAMKRQVHRAGQRADHQCLGQPRHTFQQAVPAAEQGDQQLVDHLVLAHDDARQLVQQLLSSRRQFVDRCLRCGQILSSHSCSLTWLFSSSGDPQCVRWRIIRAMAGRHSGSLIWGAVRPAVAAYSGCCRRNRGASASWRASSAGSSWSASSVSTSAGSSLFTDS